jgi:hypothetical protein
MFVLKIGSFITPVFLGAFEASRTTNGALVRWEIGLGGTALLLRLWREAGLGTRELLAQWEPVEPRETRYVDWTAPPGEANYWLQVIDGKGQEQWYGPASLEAAALPARLALIPNVPNPFNPRTTIGYALPRGGQVELVIYDLQGRLVRRLLDEMRPAGAASLDWDGLDGRGNAVSSGVYIVRLRTEQGAVSRKVTMTR